MKISKCFGKKFASAIFVSIVLLIGKPCGFSQGFINLNFENATIAISSPGAVLASQALPGWTNGFSSGATIFYNTVSIGGAAISIHDTNDPGGNVPIQGRYSVGLQGEMPGTASAGIGQTGQIPTNSQSLTFWAQLGSLQITFNGQLIPYLAIGNGPNYRIYGGDISPFAGQTGELRFTALPNTSGFIDNIQFSTSSIPEPSGLALFGVGALLLAFFRRRNSPQ